MTTFKEIRGQLIRSVSSDPANPQVGEIWYNNTIGVLKGYLNLGGVWASGGDLPVGTNQSGGAGITSASLLFGGSNPGANAANQTYEYNGTSWTPSGNLNTSRTGISGAGTQTAALGGGGYLFPGGSNHAETYDGSTWTSITTMPISQTYSSTGTQTVALYVANPGATLEYNAPAWTAGGSLVTARAEASTAGTQTAGLFFGGGPQTAASNATEEYDGSTWTTVNNMNTARGIQIGGSGVQTSALAYGGAGPNEPSKSAATESYDGTSWTTTGSLATARSMMQKGGSTSSDSTTGICAGGLEPARSTATEEYTDPTFGTQTLTTS